MSRSPIKYILILLGLILSALMVDSIYTLVIRPQALLEMQMAVEAGQPAPRSWVVLLKDTEQEITIILFLWAVGILGMKAFENHFQFGLLGRNYIPRTDGELITPERAADYYRSLQSLEDTAEREGVLPQMLISSLNHFNGTRDISSATSVAHQVGELKADHMDAELSMARYIAWAIPSIGFIGTVRGIGEAMSRAGEALEGNITGVTEALGVAFNSTLVALFLSIILMLCMHALQMGQDRLIQRCNDYCNRYLLSHLGTRD